MLSSIAGTTWQSQTYLLTLSTQNALKANPIAGLPSREPGDRLA